LAGTNYWKYVSQRELSLFIFASYATWKLLYRIFCFWNFLAQSWKPLPTHSIRISRNRHCVWDKIVKEYRWIKTLHYLSNICTSDLLTIKKKKKTWESCPITLHFPWMKALAVHTQKPRVSDPELKFGGVK